MVRVARQDQETAGCRGRARESAGGPLLGPLELVEAEQGELAGTIQAKACSAWATQSLSDTTAIRLNSE